MTTRRRWTAIIAGGAAVVLVASIVTALISSRTTAGGRHAGAPPPAATATPATTAPASATPAATGPTPTVASPPKPTDVAAARACQAFSVYLADAQKGTIPKAVGAKLVNTSGALLRGARAAEAAGRPLPKWAELGSALLAAAADVVNHDAKALATDGANADASCQRVPAGAATAGGYHRGG
jgi:hypothetical protein